jgi:hypothetical protein
MENRPAGRAAKIGLSVAQLRVAFATTGLRAIHFCAVCLIEPPAKLLIILERRARHPGLRRSPYLRGHLIRRPARR